MGAEPRRTDRAGLQRRWGGCSRSTVERKTRQWGIEPLYLGGRRLFDLDQVEQAERKMHAAHASSLPVVAARAAANRAARAVAR
jgi:hypothetical protein